MDGGAHKKYVNFQIKRAKARLCCKIFTKLYNTVKLAIIVQLHNANSEKGPEMQQTQIFYL